MRAPYPSSPFLSCFAASNAESNDAHECGAGILTLQPTSQAKTKAAGLTRHQLAMGALGVPAIVLGSLAIIANKAIHESPHFKTWHGVRP